MVTEQINLRFPPKFLADVKYTASKRGYRNVQAFIEEAVRAQVYDPELTAAEWRKVERWIEDAKDPKNIVGEKEIFTALNRRISGTDRKISGKHPRTKKKPV